MKRFRKLIFRLLLPFLRIFTFRGRNSRRLPKYGCKNPTRFFCAKKLLQLSLQRAMLSQWERSNYLTSWNSFEIAGEKMSPRMQFFFVQQHWAEKSLVVKMLQMKNATHVDCAMAHAHKQVQKVHQRPVPKKRHFSRQKRKSGIFHERTGKWRQNV